MEDAPRSQAAQADPARVAHFRILGRLGQGGMGVVYRAEDEQLRRTVAVKLLPNVSGSEEKRQRFLREARSAAAITHPNVAVIHQIGEEDGRIYIAMELVEGESLRGRLDRGRLDLATARELASQIARGLQAAHDKGIVHRDLKPENVMITPTGVVKLLDFGLAKQGADPASSGDTQAALARTETLVTSDEGRIMGTPEYMSPEQAMGAPLDVRSDLFSFGIVLYEMLAGARPFAGPSTGAVLVAIARDEPLPLRARAPEVDDATEALVARCLKKARDARFGGAGEIVAALSVPSSPRVMATTESRTDVAPITRTGVATGRSSKVARMAALLAGCLAVAWWGLAARTKVPVATAPASAVAPDAAPAGIAITDYPPPTTSSPEAAKEYAQAMQAMRDAAYESANAHLFRAVEIDPSFALAHLMLATGGWVSVDEQRKHLTVAVELRSQLRERDQGVLEAVRATLGRDTPDVEGNARRWSALADLYPLDAHLVMSAGNALLNAGHMAEGLALLDRAVALDPKFALAEGVRAWFQEGEGDLDGAMASASRCLALSPSAASCLNLRAGIEQRRGQCTELEADARKMIALEPDGVTANDWLASALMSRGASPESIAERFRRSVDHATGPEVDLARAFLPLQLAVLTGDFASFRASAPALDALVARQTSDATVSDYVAPEIVTFEEMGERDRAVAVAEAYLKRAPALTADDPTGARHQALWIEHLAGRISEAEFRAERDAWAKQAVAKSPPRSANLAWLYFYAGTAVTPADAREAFEALPGYTPLPSFEGVGYFERVMGQVLLLAGRTDEAIVHLRRAVAECFNPDYLPSHLLSAELLGEALESKNDTPGACSAYAEVLAHWGNAKPRSKTADLARSHMRKLGCPK